MTSPRAHLHLQPHATVFVFDDGATVSLGIGVQDLIDGVLRHDPPNAAELERAIDRVEDALARWPGARPTGGELVVTDPRLTALPGLASPGATLGREALEFLFQHLASRALGTPVAEASLPNGAPIAAALLVLRECLHHLGFERVVAGPV